MNPDWRFQQKYLFLIALLCTNRFQLTTVVSTVLYIYIIQIQIPFLGIECFKIALIYVLWTDIEILINI